MLWHENEIQVIQVQVIQVDVLGKDDKDEAGVHTALQSDN